MTAIRLDLLDVLGRRYLIDHCYRYLRQSSEELLLKTYITDALKMIVENTAKMSQGGVVLKDRYIDLIKRKNLVKGRNESAETIKNRIKGKLNAIGKRAE